jgi:hypothetical protein
MSIQRAKRALVTYAVLAAVLAVNSPELASAAPMITVTASGSQITINSDDPTVTVQINNKSAVLGSNTVPDGSDLVQVYFQNHIIYSKSFTIPFVQGMQPPSATTLCPLIQWGYSDTLLNLEIKQLIAFNKVSTNLLKKLATLKISNPAIANVLKQDQQDVADFFSKPPCPVSISDSAGVNNIVRVEENLMNTYSKDLTGASSFISHNPVVKKKK